MPRKSVFATREEREEHKRLMQMALGDYYTLDTRDRSGDLQVPLLIARSPAPRGGWYHHYRLPDGRIGTAGPYYY